MDKEITIIIVDDNAGAIKRLCNDLSNFPYVRILGTFQSPEKAKKYIVYEQPDILFLDVEMPEMSGLELLKSIQAELHRHTKVVIYTAYDKYIIEALRASAFDYLLKPYLLEELAAIIERYHSHVPKTTENIEKSLRGLMTQENVFALHTPIGLMLVGIDKILLFQYAKEQCCWQMMHIDGYKLYKLRKSTKAAELLACNKMFLQISKDCIINMKYLSTIETKTMRCIFCYPHNFIERTASQRFYKKIKETLEVF